jgi:hypothetical protein
MTNPSKSARTVLRYIGQMLKANGYSKHNRAGLKRRRAMRPQRRKLLSMTFSRTLTRRLYNVEGRMAERARPLHLERV